MSSFPAYDFAVLKSSCPDGPTYRAALTQLARFASKMSRWEDLCRIMKEIVRGAVSGALGSPPPPSSVAMSLTGLSGPPLVPIPSTTDPRDITAEERRLLVEGYKQLAANLRMSLRCMKVDGSLSSPSPSSLIKEYSQQVEKELSVVCTDITTLIDSALLPVVTSVESQVFYLKFVADFHRYLAEIAYGVMGFPMDKLKGEGTKEKNGGGSMSDGQSKEKDSMMDDSSNDPPPKPTQSQSTVVPLGFEKKSADYYAAAWKLSAQLDPTHPIRLGVALNYSILLYEIFKDKRGACEFGRAAFDTSIAKLDEVDDTHYKESTLIMQLIRDNLTAWTASDNEQPQQ